MFDFLRNTPIDHTVVAANHVIRALEYREDLFKSLNSEDDCATAFGLSDDERAVVLSIADEIRAIEGLPFGYLTAETASTYTALLADTVQEIMVDQLSRDDILGGSEFLQQWQTPNAEPRRYLPRDDSSRVKFLLAGLGIGALVALLFAPKSGDELRNDIADARRKGIDKSKEAAAQLGAKAGEYYDTTRQKASELYDTARETAGEYYEATRERAGELYDTATTKAGEVVAKTRDASIGQAGSLSAAIEAGKRAYVEEKRKTELSGHTEAAPIYKPDHVS